MFDSSGYEESALRSQLARDGICAPPTDVALSIRLTAWLLAGRYDRMLDKGAVPPLDTALELHARKLVTIAQREAIARSLRRVVQQAHEPPRQWSALSWAYRPSVVAAEDMIDTVTLRLHSPRPVRARGMARLRVLLSDGAGPLYMSGRDDLVGRLGAALAAL